MDKGLRPIPALYACYLLRSSVRHSSLYIGSTPDPVRRLRQHNGGVKGGAVRTSRDSLRPWEAVCLVTGFPSKIAALQFEWAWQNTHLTRHISADDRITTSKVKVKVSQRTGRVWKSRARPRTSLTDRLANLHLLLLATSFQRWPLKVTFYAEDVYKMWQRWMAKQLEAVPSHVAVDLEAISKSAETIEDSEVEDAVLPSGLPAVQVDYTATKPHLSKTQNLIADGKLQACSICHKELAQDGSGIVSCVHDSCHMMAHVSCLSAAFLASQPTAIIPTHGKCPKCSETLQWVDLVRELSLRMRGEAEIAKLFKVPRTRRKKQANGTVIEEVVAEPDVEEDEPEEEVWHNLSQSSMDIDEFESPPKTVVLPARRSTKGSKARKAVVVRKDTVEDSDWDEAELVT